MRVLEALVGVLAGSSLVGCAVTAPDTSDASTGQDTTSAATAVVAVERTTGPGDSARGDVVVARFVRVKQGSVDDPALRIAGIADDIPAPGTCIAPDEPAAVIAGRSVELLDVGQVTFASEAAGKSTVLLPRSMPDPAGVVSGVFYSSRTAEAFAAGSRVALRSTGGIDLDGFSVSVTAPRDLGDVHVVSIVAGLEVSWDATDADAHDAVYADVLSPALRAVVRCAGTDPTQGHLVVPQASIVGIDEGQVSIHRVHKESFRAKGIEPGEVRFDVAKILAFRR